MATLVLSSVGTALGGPVGGAIGALIGQSIDQQILASPSRGPRLGDLAVQTSTYGTQIPRVYGTMRVAGSVIWSTDLVESTQTSGAKGQPDATYSYSVSFAVALSSRRAASVRRIWADGKLLRGVEGDFKVSTGFRFYEGSEDQPLDPLIASAEGIANTPAYRGLAMAVFENLELAEFGNRIPFLTFEVVADEAGPSAGSLLRDMSGGIIACDERRGLIGYAAYGPSIRAAADPLVRCFGIQLFDDGIVIRSAGGSSELPVAESQLGCSSGSDRPSKIEREQTPVRSVPNHLRLAYYDPARDYQSGEARASAGGEGGDRAEEFPAVLLASDAKTLAQQMLGRAWARRDKLGLRLPPPFLSAEPGTIVLLPLAPSRWVVERVTTDGLTAVAELRPQVEIQGAMAADPGRILSQDDEVASPLTLAVLDAPAPIGQPATNPTMLLAASSRTGWKRKRIELRLGGQSWSVSTPRRKTVMGTTSSALAEGGPFLIDSSNALEVELVDPDQWLTSCDDDALGEGMNLAIVGRELIQFGIAEPVGAGRFRLSRLVRGRFGTEWAIDGHLAGEAFLLLESESLQPISLPTWARGSTLIAANGPSEVQRSIDAEGLRPPSPVSILAKRAEGGALELRWTRRSRLGWGWTDDGDAPLGEAREQYRVTAVGTADTMEWVVDHPFIALPASELAKLGPEAARFEVRQVGDFAQSRAASRTIDLA